MSRILSYSGRSAVTERPPLLCQDLFRWEMVFCGQGEGVTQRVLKKRGEEIREMTRGILPVE